MITESLEKFTEVETLTNPFPGLRPFEFHENHLFFGRDGQSEELLGKLSKTRFLAVVGTSGSGKSSLVRAGLLPALCGGLMTRASSNWRVAVLRPGNDPLGNLARALNDPTVFGLEEGVDPTNHEPLPVEQAAIQSTLIEVTLRRSSLGLIEAVRQARMPEDENLLIVVDQFEELFRFARISEDEKYENDAAAFVKVLLEAKRQRELPIYVVLTMRSDYLGDCARFWDLPEAINEGQYLIPRMTRDQRREAIVGPVAVYGGEIAQRLVNQLLNDMGDNPGQLPILQHALMRIWDQGRAETQGDKPLDLQHYESVGGLSETLSRHADEAYNELPDDRSRKIAEKLFKCLAERGPDERETRRPTELWEICAVAEASEKEVIAVIETFRLEGRSFLMPPAGVPLKGDSLIDISHESLIRGWHKLNVWVDEEAQSISVYRRLADTALLHEKHKTGLLSDTEVRWALEWREQNKPNPAWAARHHRADFERTMAFLEKSREERDHAIAEKERQRKREIQRKFTRVFTAVLAGASVICLALAIYAFKQRAEAFKKGESNKLLVYGASVNLAQNAFEKVNYAKANELLQALYNPEQSGSRNFEWYHLWRSFHDETATLKHSQDVTAVAFSPNSNSKILVTGSNDGTIRLWDSDKRQVLKTLEEPASATSKEPKRKVSSLAFSADSKKLAAGRQDGRVRLWDTTTWQFKELKPGSTAQGFRASVAFSSDGKMLATTGTDKMVKLWNTETGQELPGWEKHENPVSVAFSSDGKTLAAGSEDGSVKLWDIQSRQEYQLKDEELAQGQGTPSPVLALAFSPDGRIFATGHADSTIRVWDASSRTLLVTLRRHAYSVSSVAFLPDGKTLISGSWDGSVKLWDLTPLSNGSNNSPVPATAADDGEPLSNNNVLHMTETHTYTGHSNYILALALSPDGQTFATGSADATAKLWPIVKREEFTTLKQHQGDVSSIAMSRDGKILATGSEDSTIMLWDTSNGTQLDTLRGHERAVRSVVFSQSNSRILATGGDDGVINLWDVSARKLLDTLRGHESAVRSVAFSPDGNILATGSDDGVIKFWNVSKRQEIPAQTKHQNAVLSLAFSPDGRRLASGGADGHVKLWDAHTREAEKTLFESANRVLAVAFSPSGTVLATGSDDKTASLWDISTGREMATLKGHRDGISSLSFSSDGKRLATGSRDGSVKLWDMSDELRDISSRQELITLPAHLSPLSAVAFSPDDNILVTASTDNTAKLWYSATDNEVKAQQ